MGHDYVYKYVDKNTNEILYIGKTTGLQKRIKQHSHEYYFSNCKNDIEIYWCKCKNAAHMNLLEAYLIDKYQPKLNKALKCGDSLDINMPEPDWLLFEEKSNKKKGKSRTKPLNKKYSNMQNLSYYKGRFERIRVLNAYLKAIPCFYRRFKNTTRDSNFIVISNVYEEEKIKGEWSKYYFSYSWNNNKCKDSQRCSLSGYYLDEMNNTLILIINKNLYKSQLYYKTKFILRKIRKRYIKEINTIIRELSDNYNGFLIHKNDLLEWEQYFDLIKST